MKVAPILRCMKQMPETFSPILVHTGQHYDDAMSDAFFRDLGLVDPGYRLGVGSGSHAEQTGQAMIAFEGVLLKERPDIVVVVGDVNPTLACAIDAAKLSIPVAHVEAGLRSRDMQMPEEINRILTDAVSTYLFTPSPDADENLLKEGLPKERIFRVGNVMIDSLRCAEDHLDGCDMLDRLRIKSEEYAVLTLHRPSNVDDDHRLTGILTALEEIQQELKVIFPIHPRTRKRIAEFGLEPVLNNMDNLSIAEPVSYLESLCLLKDASFVMTDSGGVQEETTVLGVPCLTLRDNTERPVTVNVGTNTVVGVDPASILKAARSVLEGRYKKGRVPELWDGEAAERIIRVLAEHDRV